MVVSLRNIYAILLSIIMLGGLLFSLFDETSLAEGQYLALITSLTVGYGDLAPQSWPARIVSGVVALTGVILTGVIIASIVKAVELAFREDLESLEEIKRVDSKSSTNPARGDSKDRPRRS